MKRGRKKHGIGPCESGYYPCGLIRDEAQRPSASHSTIPGLPRLDDVEVDAVDRLGALTSAVPKQGMRIGHGMYSDN